MIRFQTFVINLYLRFPYAYRTPMFSDCLLIFTASWDVYKDVLRLVLGLP